ncbi:MAG TPA: chloride channel protein [Dehalococcoidia bacterium]|nr:chloride channel protein [Dehalococcoidia bacterium]
MGAVAAVMLVRLIYFFTNLFFFQRISIDASYAADNTLGVYVIAAPMIGAALVGLMARYGTDKIRGHGIPEAIEAIVLRGSMVTPRVAIFKPLSAAVAIGSGGPFGAEGPVIMTGGAFSSLMAQCIHLSDSERKTLMVAGAAAGLSGIFGTPFAATLLAVELLLFEWKPRSLIPVAVACIVAFTLRHYLIGSESLFAAGVHTDFAGPVVFAVCAGLGIVCGVASAILTELVFFWEEAFERLPIHWMWWPIIGAVAIGIGGYLVPRTFGPGYATIDANLNGELAVHVALAVLFVKTLIWSISLGSGTSGGELAPLMMIGSAVGAVFTGILPHEGPGFYAIIGMAAVLGGTLRAPLMAIMFALESTHDFNMLVPLLCGVGASYAFTVLTMKRSLATRKLTERGYHLSSEFAVDPLEVELVGVGMQTDYAALTEGASAGDIEEALARVGQSMFPVVDADGQLTLSISRADLINASSGVLTWEELLMTGRQSGQRPVMGYVDEPLRVAAYRMSSSQRTQLPVVERRTRKLVGVITLSSLLSARARAYEADTRRRRLLSLHLLSRKESRLEE